ncbi:hypothetical protein FG379_003523 [Cryptosporidium bovis]|uniref:uncharacterized protein n=1 Tax=Cryptosporidium bovis TaxID=310047 RepID=UPI003519F405|nr:hypothetical protein FG379_003523 [Cryptosporidium bovis]
MEINDIIRVLYTGLLNKEIISESKEFNGNSLIKKIFLDDEFNVSDKKTDDFTSLYLTDIEGLDIFNDRLVLFLDGSPHNLRLLITYLIDFFMSYFESLKHKKVYLGFTEKNQSLKLDLPPIPYIDGCKDFLYLFNLKLLCNYNMNYKDWVEIFFKLDILLRDRNMGLSVMRFKSYKTVDFSIIKFGDFSTNDHDKISNSYLNILQNDNIIQNFPYISLLVNGLKLIKKIETKQVGEIYIKYAISILSEDSKRFNEGIEQIKSNVEVRFITTIYCLISLSIYSSRIGDAIIYISCAQRLLRSSQKIFNSSLITMLNIYVLLTKLHVLLNAVEERENSIFNSVPVNKVTSLNLLVTNTFLDIRNEVVKNSRKMNSLQCTKLLKHITDYTNYIFENFPIMFPLNRGNEGLFNTKITAIYDLCLSKTRTIHSVQTGPQILMQVHDLFSFLIREKICFKNKDMELRVHSIICWENIIPNILLGMSDEVTFDYRKESSNLYFIQLAGHLMNYTKLIYEVPIEESMYSLSRCDFAEIYLFIALYLYLGKVDIVRSGEFIKYAKDTLNPCNCSFEVCSIQCIILYLELIISLRNSSDEAKIESTLIDMVNFGKKSLYFMPPKEKEINHRRKLVNYSTIQGYTLLSLLRNDCNLLSNEELEFLINTKDQNESDESNELSSEGNPIISNYLNIADCMKVVLGQ